MQIDHRTEIEKLTFRALALRQSKYEGLTLWRRVNARNVSFSNAVRWSIYIINSVDKPNFRVSLPHRRSTTVSLETYPLFLFSYLPGSSAQDTGRTKWHHSVEIAINMLLTN